MATQNRWLRLTNHVLLSSVLTFGMVACVTQQPPEVKTGETGATTSTATGGDANTITVYTALEDDQLAKYLPLFEKAHPEIKVNKVRDSTGVVTAKLLAEKDNP
jgi:iron(III) transport system substrate-binding protein